MKVAATKLVENLKIIRVFGGGWVTFSNAKSLSTLYQLLIHYASFGVTSIGKGDYDLMT